MTRARPRDRASAGERARTRAARLRRALCACAALGAACAVAAAALGSSARVLNARLSAAAVGSALADARSCGGSYDGSRVEWCVGSHGRRGTGIFFQPATTTWAGRSASGVARWGWWAYWDARAASDEDARMGFWFTTLAFAALEGVFYAYVQGSAPAARRSCVTRDATRRDATTTDGSVDGCTSERKDDDDD